MPQFPHAYFKTSAKQTEKVWMLSEWNSWQGHETDYLEIRKKEGHLIKDDQVLGLPKIHPDSSMKELWMMRKQSAEALKTYLTQKKRSLKILEVGCGNGWFTQLLATVPGSRVLGLDYNLPELKQGARLFESERTQFAYGDVFGDILVEKSWDCILLNASIQYFPDTTALLDRLITLLDKGGEIHILDSAFYHTENQKATAAKKSKEYFEKMGVPNMENHFHHILLNELDKYQPTYRHFNKNPIKKLLGIPQNPMPWIQINARQ